MILMSFCSKFIGEYVYQ